jgi:predicted RNase H-like HicB family nuclease
MKEHVTLPAYPAKFELEKDGGYSVSFPDVKGCYTCGDDLEEAKAMAIEALSGMMECLIADGRTIPLPSVATGEDIYYIEPILLDADVIEKFRRRCAKQQRVAA